MARKHPRELSEIDRAKLVTKPGHVIKHKAATLRAEPGNTPNGDRVFAMRGPSGEHRLLVCATPTDRLNAHWRVFASHAANQ